MPKRLTIVLDDEAAARLLDLAGSSRNQSKILSQLIRQATKQRLAGAGPDLDKLRLQMLDLSGELAGVARLLKGETDHA